MPGTTVSRAALRMILVLAALATFGASAHAQDYGIAVLNAQPRALQPVYVRVAFAGCKQVKSVRNANSVITVSYVSTLCGVPPPGTYHQEVSIGSLPQGSYRVQLVDAESPVSAPLSEVELVVLPPVPGRYGDEFEPLVDYSGAWWDPAEAGDGFFVQHQVPDQGLVVWNRHDASGRPEWLIMQVTRRSYAHLSGTVYRATGVPPNTSLVQVGTADFYGRDASHARFAYAPAADTGEPAVVKELRRFP